MPISSRAIVRAEGVGVGRRDRMTGDRAARRRPARQGSTFIPGEPMKWPTKVCSGRSNSSTGVPIWTTSPIVHDHHLVGEGQRLGLVVGDVDHGHADLVVQFLELGAQHPFEVRVDDGQRLVEHDHVDVGAHQAAAERDLLLAVGGQAGGAVAEHARSAPASRRSRGRAGRPRPRARRDCAAERPDCRTPSWCRRSPGTGTPGRCCAGRAAGR